MVSYQYDESGKTTAFFFFTILSLYMIPTTIGRLRRTYSWLTGKRNSKESETKWTHWTNVLYVVALIAFIFTYRYINSVNWEEQVAWNPYDILGVSEGADSVEIKTAYKQLSLRWHPDKNMDNREEAERRFVDISKAYKTLTDETARASWLKYGNPDERRDLTFGIALPQWLVSKDNSTLVLAIYFGILITVVISVGVWWRRAKKFTVADILAENEPHIFRRLLLFRKANSGPPKIDTIVEILVTAPEFRNLAAPTDVDQQWVAKLVKESSNFLGFPKVPKTANPIFHKIHALLYCRLNRKEVPSNLQSEYEFFLTKSVRLLTIITNISVTRQMNLLPVAERALELCQMILQGVWDRDMQRAALLQLPHMDDDNLKYCLERKNKKERITSIRKMVETPEVKKKDIFRSMDSAKFNEMVDSCKNFPIVDMVLCKVFVASEGKDGEKIRDETNLCARDLISVKLRFRVRYGIKELLETASEYKYQDNVDSDDEDDSRKSTDGESQSSILAKTPGYPGTKRPVWYVFLSDPRYGVLGMKTIFESRFTEEDNDILLKASAKFVLATPGDVLLNVHVVCDSYVGSSVIQVIPLKIQNSRVPEQVEEGMKDGLDDDETEDKEEYNSDSESETEEDDKKKN